MSDSVNHPSHYQSGSGIECSEVRAPLPTFLSDAVKYVWRAPYKGNHRQDLEKALWCINEYIHECEVALGPYKDNTAQMHAVVELGCDFCRLTPYGDRLSSADEVWEKKVDVVTAYLEAKNDSRAGVFRDLRELDVRGVKLHIESLLSELK